MASKLINLKANKEQLIRNEGKAYSELIDEYMAAFQNDFPKDLYFEDIIELTVSTWNFANFKNNLTKDEFHGIFDLAEKDENYDLIMKMIDYKNAHFSNYTNYISDYNLREINGQNVLDIVSQPKDQYLKSIAAEIAEQENSGLDQSHFNEDYIDRCAITIRYKKTFYGWLYQCYPDQIPFDEDGYGSSVYLIQSDFDEWLRKNYDKIFQIELGSWNADKKSWPKQRSYKMFKEWFKIELSKNVYDFERKPIYKGQYIDE